MLNESLEKSPQFPRRLPNQRWQIHPSNPQLSQELATINHISPIVAQLLINRGFLTPENAQVFLNPDSLNLPSPFEDFPDLAISVELLEEAITNNSKIAICGDYDADGMTSTALLLRSLRALGANVDYAIPSRMKDGYGINNRIVQEFYEENVKLILTVDNGISAFEPIKKAKELGLKIIITDHHDIPPELPPADAILNPKLIKPSSPYRGIAGVGVAYILAISIAQQLGEIKGLVAPLLCLFTLGTIADLAPLTGVNRRWLQRGLKLLPKSNLPGIQALIQVAGVQSSDSTETISNNTNNQQKPVNNKTLKPEDIGFKLGPRINAIGRIGDPQIVIDLLTTDDMGMALTKAMQCEQTNTERQRLCEEIEQEAIAMVEELYVSSLSQDRVLLVIKENWHHGVIGIVASRLLERYGVPVFIATYEHDHIIRGSARGIPEFHVFQALQFCDDLLGKYGGHQAAGGFSLPANNLDDFRLRLIKFANECLEIHHLKPLLKIDTQINLHDINYQLYQQLNILHPCGIDNPDPVFWTENVHVLEQQVVGKGHIKFTVVQETPEQQIKGIFWRSRDYFPLPPRIDIAYKLRENNYNGKTTVELELIGFKLPDYIIQLFSNTHKLQNIKFQHHQNQYSCGIYNNGVTNELRIKNSQGKVLVMQPGEKTGLLGLNRENAQQINLALPQYDTIIQAALKALLTAGNE